MQAADVASREALRSEMGNMPVEYDLIAPDDVPAHPYKVAMEGASLAPKAEVTIYPWKDAS